MDWDHALDMLASRYSIVWGYREALKEAEWQLGNRQASLADKLRPHVNRAVEIFNSRTDGWRVGPGARSISVNPETRRIIISCSLTDDDGEPFRSLSAETALQIRVRFAEILNGLLIRADIPLRLGQLEWPSYYSPEHD